MIAHLKDQLQEMKAKTSMEGKYIKKDAEVKFSNLKHTLTRHHDSKVKVCDCYVVQYFEK